MESNERKNVVKLKSEAYCTRAFKLMSYSYHMRTDACFISLATLKLNISDFENLAIMEF